MSDPPRGYSRLIPKESLEDIRRWDVPDVNPRPVVPQPEPEPEYTGPPLPTVEEIEALQKEAYDEGYQQGLEEGRVAGQAEYDEKLAETTAERHRLEEAGELLAQLVRAMDQPFAELDEQVEVELAELAMAVAQRIVPYRLK